MRVPARSWLALGPLLLCGLAFLPYNGPRIELLSKSDQVAKIDQWEERVLSGRSEQQGLPLALGSKKTSPAVTSEDGSKVGDMVNSWENSVLSGKLNGDAVWPHQGLALPSSSKTRYPPASHVAEAFGTAGAAARSSGSARHWSDSSAVVTVSHERTRHDAAAFAASGGPERGGWLKAPSSARSEEGKGLKSAAHLAAPAVQSHASTVPHLPAQGSKSSQVGVVANRSGHAAAMGEHGVGSSNARGEASSIKVAEERKANKLNAEAAQEDQQARNLVGYANKIAQKIVKEQALEEMKNWLAAQQRKQALMAHASHKHTVTTSSSVKKQPASDGQTLKKELGQLKHTVRKLAEGGDHGSLLNALKEEVDDIELVGGRMLHRVKHAKALASDALGKNKVKPVAKKALVKQEPLTEVEHIRAQYAKWREDHVHNYVHEHELFSASEFCNSRQTSEHPSIKDLVKLFGPQWKQMALTNPEVASIAAVSPCLAALGKVSKGIATASQYEGTWKQGALKGKAEDVKRCAAGNDKACVEISRDPAALSALRKLIPTSLQK